MLAAKQATHIKKGVLFRCPNMSLDVNEFSSSEKQCIYQVFEFNILNIACLLWRAVNMTRFVSK